MTTYYYMTLAYHLRRFAAYLAIALVATLLLACSPTPSGDTGLVGSTSNEANCARSVAHSMGIEWTWEDGATERLSEYEGRVHECVQPMANASVVTVGESE